jgi:adhesin/invasin
VTFSTSDPDPGVVLAADYTFTAADGGVHTFTDTGLGETTLVTPGVQTLTVTDTADHTVSGSSSVTVNGPAPWPGRHGLGQPPSSFPASTGQAQVPTRSEPSPHEVAAVDRWFAAVPEGDVAGPTWSWVKHHARREADAWLSDLFGREDLLLL